MTFLNAALLGGLAAVAIPVLIHLFHRSRFRVVRWGAMHLLESVLRHNRRRLRLEQLILLLVRCTIPCFLALLMARPVLTGTGDLLGHRKTSTVILLDNSYSMEAGGPARSNFHLAREAAARILEALVPGSEAAVVRMAGGVSGLLDEPTFDLERLKAELMAARAGFGSAAVPEALRFAGILLGKMHLPNRDVVLLSDFQRVSWENSEALARAKAIEELLRSPLPPALTFYHAGREIRENVCVESLETSRMILGVGQKLQVRATLVNHGETDATDLRVAFRVDGVERQVSSLPFLGAGQKGQVLFTHSFDTAGSHVIEVRAEADPLQADNACLMSLPVWNRVPVLLVTGDPNPEPLRGETDFLEIALRPYTSAGADLADLIATRVVEARAFDPALLGEARVVVLANVPQLAEAPLRALEDFVREGGGLLVFPGNRINSAWYNAAFFADGRGLLPLPLASLAGTTLQDRGTHASIVSQNYEHPALELFNDPRHGRLSDAQIWLWYRLRGETSPRPGDPGLAVLARLDSGDPFLVEKRFGEGRVIQCAIPCDADWSNLPMRPFYLPLMQQLTTYLASKVFPPRNVEVGRTLVAFLPPSEAGRRAVLTDPEGKTHELKAVPRGARAVIEYAQTRQPGLYTLEVAGGERLHFVVNTDRRESDLRQLGPAEVEGVAKALGARVVRSWEEYRKRDQERRFGQEVWPFLLVLVVGFLFAEVALEQLFARRKA